MFTFKKLPAYKRPNSHRKATTDYEGLIKNKETTQKPKSSFCLARYVEKAELINSTDILLFK